jgi:RNA polymerase sigma-70 factor, ECF subfamily
MSAVQSLTAFPSPQVCHLHTAKPSSFDDPGTRHVPSFDDVVLPHRSAALRLARWLLRDEDDAQDVVQEALLRALRYFGTFRGGNGRAWFLRIVKNTSEHRRAQHVRAAADLFDEEHHVDEAAPITPESLLLRRDVAESMDAAMRTLPERSRHLLMLREVHGLSYQELAVATAVPIGTVMSRLSRARRALKRAVERQREPLEVRKPQENQKGRVS